MKRNLYKLLTLLTVSLLVASSLLNHLGAQVTYASVSSGYWGQTSPYIWETFASGAPVGAMNTGTAATGVPSGSNNIYVRSPHTVFTGNASGTNASRNAYSVTIESGAALLVGNSTAQNIRPGTGASGASGLNVTVTNNGTMGGATDGLFVEVGAAASTLTMTGSGTTILQRMRFVAANVNAASSLIFDQNVTLTLADNYALTATSTAQSSSDNNTITINAGKTVTISNGYLHLSGVASGVAPAGGNYTYNINGTLDMSPSATTGNTVLAGSSVAGKSLTVNLNGIMKLPLSGTSGLNISEAAGSGQQGTVNFFINNNAELIAYSGTLTTSETRYFKITGTGVLRRTVASASGDVLFAVGTPTSYSPATISNSGTSDLYSVNVQSSIDNAPPTTNVVTKQWRISENVAGGGQVGLKLAWLSTDEAPGFVRTNPISIMMWNGTQYIAVPATLVPGGAGTSANPYVATTAAGAITSNLSNTAFIVANGGGAVPVTFANIKAYQKNTGIQVDWTSATEINADKYIVERSADGRSFTEAGSINAKGNSATATSYSWFDAKPGSGNNYYRVKSIDKDGSVKYTSIMKVTMGKGNQDITISPNPVRGKQLSLQLSNLGKGVYTVDFINGNGQNVYTKQIAHEGGSETQIIQLPSNLNKGIYSVRLTGADVRLNKSIIVE